MTEHPLYAMWRDFEAKIPALREMQERENLAEWARLLKALGPAMLGMSAAIQMLQAVGGEEKP